MARSRFCSFFFGVGTQGTQGSWALLRHFGWQDIRQSKRGEREEGRGRDRREKREREGGKRDGGSGREGKESVR